MVHPRVLKHYGPLQKQLLEQPLVQGHRQLLGGVDKLEFLLQELWHPFHATEVGACCGWHPSKICFVLILPNNQCSLGSLARSCFSRPLQSPRPDCETQGCSCSDASVLEQLVFWGWCMIGNIHWSESEFSKHRVTPQFREKTNTILTLVLCCWHQCYAICTPWSKNQKWPLR